MVRFPGILRATLFLSLVVLPGCRGGPEGAPDAGRGPGPVTDAGADAAGLPDGDARDLADGATLDGWADAGTADTALGDTAAADGTAEDCPPYAASDLQDQWTSADGLNGTALRQALLALVRGHRVLAYDEAKTTLFGAGGIDVHGGKVECVYTGRIFSLSDLDESGGFNTEHSWPQSEFPSWAGATPKSDLHHLFPTEISANSRRSSYPFGETDCAATVCDWQEGGSELGPRIGGSEKVFEVRPTRRGDIARAHFYFAVRYEAAIPDFEEETLRRWHRCDPPDALERARNDAIEAAQGNRNPFVDRPEFADRIADY